MHEEINSFMPDNVGYCGHLGSFLRPHTILIRGHSTTTEFNDFTRISK